MRASVLWIVVSISLFSGRGSAGCLGQEKPSELTIEEIVSRHEATWEKLKRLRFDLETQNRLTFASTSSRISPSGKVIKQVDPRTSESDVKGNYYIDGNRTSAEFQVVRTAEVAVEVNGAEFVREQAPEGVRPKTREIFDMDLLIAINPKHISIQKIANKPHPQVANFILGRGLSLHLMAPTKSLRDWCAEAKPVVTNNVNDSGERCWTLTGKISTPGNPTGPKSDLSDDLVVTLNESHAFLIESVYFACAKQEHFLAPKDACWTVVKWQDAGAGLSFPAEFDWNLSYWNLPTKNWLKGTLTNLVLNPADLETHFQYEFQDGMVIVDTSGRPDIAPVRIWGPDGRPTESYASEELYNRERRARGMVKTMKRQEEHVAAMFPGCTVKVTRIEEKDDFNTVVYDELGAVLQEFKSNEELAIFEGVREMIRVALGAGEQETRRR